MYASKSISSFSILPASLLILVSLACGHTRLAAETSLEAVLANSNQAPAGRLQSGHLTIHLEAAMGAWAPEEDKGPALTVAAFREPTGPLSTPGPLLRVPQGTVIDATVRNRLDRPLTIHGLHARPGDANDLLVVPAGESREVHFPAGAPGTYFYWGSRSGAESPVLRRAEDSQLNGAFVVDPSADALTIGKDRILVISDWLVLDDETTIPPTYRELFVLNGRSWPHTEHLIYQLGETVHWRIINASDSNHPMHLHGFYFRVESAGDLEKDTIYGAEQSRLVVTEMVRPGHTFTLTWTPDRSGNWIFHCHVLRHVAPERRFWKPEAALPHDAASHAREAMAGLVIGITILPGRAPVHASTKSHAVGRNIELVAAELPGFFGANPGMAFAVKNTSAPLTRPSIPGPPLLVTQNEPTAVRIVNRLREALTIHWHGIELESAYDGVAGVSGSGDSVMQPIPPGGSFTARFTPPRAGTFIYHSHIDDVKQISSGLYGPLIVLPPGATFDPDHDRVLVISRGGPGETPIWLNGSSSPAINPFIAGQTYRLRIMSIVPENPPIDVSLKFAGTLAMWRPVAKDGADLPAAQRELRPSQLTIGVGETYDFEFRPDQSGEVALSVVRPANRFPAEITPSHKTVELRPESRVDVKIQVRTSAGQQ